MEGKRDSRELSEVDQLEEIATCLKQSGYSIGIKEKVQGKSGANYIIDIIAKKAELPMERVLLVKCKLQKKTEVLRIDEVTAFWAQIFDTGADRGLIITTANILEDAKIFAHFNKIPTIYGKNLEDLKRKLLVEWYIKPQ